MKRRVQHPDVHERKGRGANYWFFRYWEDKILPDGSIKSSRKFHICGDSSGPKKISRKRAEIIRDDFLADLNAGTNRSEVATQQPAPAPQPPPVLQPPSVPQPAPTEPKPPVDEQSIDPGQIIFGRLAQLWKTNYVEKVAAGKHLIAATTRGKYLNHLKNHILPRWGNTRLAELRAVVVLEWLQDEAEGWYMMADLRNIMSGIITKAQQWEILPETFANPIQRVKMPKKWEKYEKRILTDEQTARVFAHLTDPNLLICETCLDTSTRISEVTALKIKHVDLANGTIHIAQRNWHGDIDVPKTEKSKRTLALGGLTARYKAWIAGLKRQGPEDWVFPQDDDLSQPRWDSGVRTRLKKAAKAEGVDFPGFGPHSLRRANITLRQEVGGSSIEASKIAGHSNVKMTEEYTIVQLKRQQELTRRIQERRAKAAKKAQKVLEMKKEGTAA